jgi:hypothetical protein
MNDRIIKYVLGTYQIIVALAVGIYYCVGSAMPLERDTWLSIWQFLDLMMVAALAIAIAVSVIRKRRLSGGPSDGITREYLGVHASLYASLAVAMIFLWNWTTFVLFPDGGNSDVWPHSEWSYVEVFLPLVVGSNGFFLWSSASEEA